MVEPEEQSIKDVWRRHLAQQDKVTAWVHDVLLGLGVDFSSGRVLDLGTGYGSYLSELASANSTAEFLGVDKDAEAIRYARSQTQTQRNVSFLIADVESASTEYIESGYDLGIARLLVQHLSSPQGFAEHAANVIRPGGRLVVVDAYEPFKRIEPVLPTYRAIFEDLRSRQDEKRSMSLLGFQEALRKGGFVVRDEQIRAGYEQSHFSAEDFLTMCRLNLAVVRDILGGRGNFNEAFRELDDWFRSPDRFASIGAYILVAERRSDR